MATDGPLQRPAQPLLSFLGPQGKGRGPLGVGKNLPQRTIVLATQLRPLAYVHPATCRYSPDPAVERERLRNVSPEEKCNLPRRVRRNVDICTLCQRLDLRGE